MKLWGVIFQHKDEETLYLAGDTIFCDFVKNAIAQYAPTKIIINCADAPNLNIVALSSWELMIF